MCSDVGSLGTYTPGVWLGGANLVESADLYSCFALKSADRRDGIMLAFQWGEILGLRLEEMIANERQGYALIDEAVADPEKQKELLLQDEEEDFLDEGTSFFCQFTHCFPNVTL